MRDISVRRVREGTSRLGTARHGTARHHAPLQPLSRVLAPPRRVADVSIVQGSFRAHEKQRDLE